MDRQCPKCGRQMQIIALPGQMDSVRCLPCTPTTVQLPKTKHDTGRVAAVIEHYDEMPLQGDDGDTYYVTSMQAIVRWCDKAQDWQILPLSDFKMMHPEDEHNNRRAAIMAQKARKKHGTRS